MKTIHIISKQVYDLWQKYRIDRGDVPAKNWVALELGIKTKDVNDCIKYCERGKIKLDKVKKQTGKITAKDCDELWAKAVKARAKYKCERSGETSELQAHHIIPRTNWALRYDLENGVCLCKYHHLFWAHKDTTAFSEWIKTKRDMKYLESKRGNRSKHDFSAIYIYLTNEITKYGSGSIR